MTFLKDTFLANCTCLFEVKIEDPLEGILKRWFSPFLLPVHETSKDKVYSPVQRDRMQVNLGKKSKSRKDRGENKEQGEDQTLNFVDLALEDAILC